MSASRARWMACLCAAAAIPAYAAAATQTPAAITQAPPAITQAPAATAGSAAGSSYSAVTPDHLLSFPADFGSHPQFRTEWWYVTGWLTTEHGESLGFQITFFRTKPGVDQNNPSSFAPRQILIAHCAISDPKRGRLWQDQRIRRAGLGLAEAATGDTHVWLDDWVLERHAPASAAHVPASAARSAYSALIHAEDFSFDLTLLETQAPLLNGDSGLSRKGPEPQAASYYYSLPHVEVSGRIARQGHTDRVTGEAWLDHEWSSEYLDAAAVGWDWIGINLNDGAALMAFRIRGSQGEQRWAGGTFRDSGGKTQILRPADVEFHAGRRWASPRTGIVYPVQWHVRAGRRELDLEPLLDDQENDTRLSTGAIYWEGAVRAYEKRRLAGRGYLELTGYGEPLRLR